MESLDVYTRNKIEFPIEPAMETPTTPDRIPKTTTPMESPNPETSMSIPQLPKPPTEIQPMEMPKLKFDRYPLPGNRMIGYYQNETPLFWKQIFSEEELEILRKRLRKIAEGDIYKGHAKPLLLCNLLERIFPAYQTNYTRHGNRQEDVHNVSLLNCVITLFYGILLHKLIRTNKDYIFLFKGGRALQLSLNTIGKEEEIGKYFSEDTDIVIVPNKRHANAKYTSHIVKSFSGHIAFLLKWLLPSALNKKIEIHMPQSKMNKSENVTKILYKNGNYYKALSDIGVYAIPEKDHFFDKRVEFSFFIKDLDANCFFMVPDVDSQLTEKLFYYSNYFTEKQDHPEDTLFDYYLSKFKRSIEMLIRAIFVRDYSGTPEKDREEAYKYILRSVIGDFSPYSNEQKETIIDSILNKRTNQRIEIPSDVDDRLVQSVNTYIQLYLKIDHDQLRSSKLNRSIRNLLKMVYIRDLYTGLEEEEYKEQNAYTLILHGVIQSILEKKGTTFSEDQIQECINSILASPL